MSIGTVKGIDYLGDLFDSFYLQREYNRDFKRVHLLSEACKERGKELFMLAHRAPPEIVIPLAEYLFAGKLINKSEIRYSLLE